MNFEKYMTGMRLQQQISDGRTLLNHIKIQQKSAGVGESEEFNTQTGRSSALPSQELISNLHSMQALIKIAESQETIMKSSEKKRRRLSAQSVSSHEQGIHDHNEDLQNVVIKQTSVDSNTKRESISTTYQR